MQKQKLSHAFLLVGTPGTPLLETAKFLAKSILCDTPNPLACENCITCLRVESNNYPDLITFDGSSETIKKKNISEIESRFEKKAFEKKGIMIYILHLVENTTVEAINSILKFLEEPEAQVYAFLTTNNENAILPTIVSRCQLLHLKLIPREQVINDAMSFGVAKDDAEILSYFYNEGELIFDILNSEENADKSEMYHDAKTNIMELLNELNKDDSRHAIYFVERKIIPKIKDKETARFFIDILIQVFEDLLNIQNQKPIMLKSYDTILTALSTKIKHIDQTLVELLKQRSALNTNLNIALLLNHIILTIIKE